ncbi:hypothetical protein [Actinoplanes sp. L3-i22]|uniref:hypothetical protein n=1 Tax=Actinoplanes sp. L3-i22 TaxID=2836373 RepID=UPI001C748087|nr:hypothetical protein [Actinoplanes sp. L3-i22]BCY09627.1 hypothetical protein L3i22_047150 [Actinoplanes sp. L3-i22]
MDSSDAANALAEMERRAQQTVDRGGPRRLPPWFVYGTAAALVLPWASADLNGWPSTALILASGLAVVALTVTLERVTGVRLRMRMRSLRLGPPIAYGLAVVAVGILVGSVLRFYDVPVAGTVAGVAAGIVWVAAAGRVQAAAVRPGRR